MSLRIRVSARRGFFVPLARLRVILLPAQAVLVKGAKVIHGLGASRRHGFFVPLPRLRPCARAISPGRPFLSNEAPRAKSAIDI